MEHRDITRASFERLDARREQIATDVLNQFKNYIGSAPTEACDFALTTESNSLGFRLREFTFSIGSKRFTGSLRIKFDKDVAGEYQISDGVLMLAPEEGGATNLYEITVNSDAALTFTLTSVDNLKIHPQEE